MSKRIYRENKQKVTSQNNVSSTRKLNPCIITSVQELTEHGPYRLMNLYDGIMNKLKRNENDRITPHYDLMVRLFHK